MKKEKDNPNYNSSVQKILNRLISEEIAAYYLYKGCIAAACPCQNTIIGQLFAETAEDEKDDHYKHLIEWAIQNRYSIPFKFKDFEKHAEKCIAQLNNLKSDKEALYYVDEAIQSEKDAIISYTEAMNDKNVPYELNAILLQNYYDEIEHLQKLETMKYALESGCESLSYNY